MKKLISTLLVLLFSQEFLSDSYEDEVRKRLGLLKNKPMVTMASDSDASESVAAGRTGEAVYNLGCAACHTAGLAGAPMLANQAQWEGRLEKGLETLTNNAYNGYNAMPAKGLCMDCSLEEIERSVQYMLDSLTVN
ncbi:MAG: c-type cytochrome [Pseudomonadota bacterium]|jgi:cytochrome c5|nr:c-type cytochrome [Pseudomonadota bacterium]MEC7513448.1 c-type cytochrome [Pseudomonadota bacterium]MEC7805167.1 c-type cytochrome [Pseudomonadota bacterium]MEC8152589.1 c-type cytochrome [Pseudomonadota bacterium]GIR08520.1 MAG: cytochrome c [Gammaproteobacteria bacterium]|tara:strand:+ start:727 stop:1134 length:408 start_codon:yes stop_codon:yes gene_type:complete